MHLTGKTSYNFPPYLQSVPYLKAIPEPVGGRRWDVEHYHPLQADYLQVQGHLLAGLGLPPLTVADPLDARFDELAVAHHLPPPSPAGC